MSRKVYELFSEYAKKEAMAFRPGSLLSAQSLPPGAPLPGAIRDPVASRGFCTLGVRRSPLVLGATLGALLCGALVCAPNVEPWLRRPKERAILWDGLLSYTPRSEVEKRFPTRMRRNAEEHKGRSRGCGSREIDYSVVVLRIWGARHLHCGGVLTLTFLNDRLVRAQFQPIHAALYLERLVAETPLRLPATGPSRRMRLPGAPPHTEVLVETVGDRIRVTWSDRRLLKAYWEVQSRGSSRYVR